MKVLEAEDQVVFGEYLAHYKLDRHDELDRQIEVLALDPAFKVDNLAGKLRWNVGHDSAYSAGFNEENAASHGLVSGV